MAIVPLSETLIFKEPVFVGSAGLSDYVFSVATLTNKRDPVLTYYCRSSQETLVKDDSLSYCLENVENQDEQGKRFRTRRHCIDHSKRESLLQQRNKSRGARGTNKEECNTTTSIMKSWSPLGHSAFN